jgi:hypothetical protein
MKNEQIKPIKERAMFSLRTDWNPKQTALREALSKPERFNESIRLCLELHGFVHFSQVAPSKKTPIFDELLNGLMGEASHCQQVKGNSLSTV